MPMKNCDTFYTEPDTVDEMHCRVCGAKCLVERSLTGPTGFAEAAAGHGHWHDKFTCPHHNRGWHQQALELFREIEQCPSKRMAALMQADLDEILRDAGVASDS